MNKDKLLFVSKTFTNLPVEVCGIIYEYYKLPFKDEIHYWVKFSLVDMELLRTKGYLFGTELFDSKYYRLTNDYFRKTIFGKQLIDRSGTNADISFYLRDEWLERSYIIKICRDNGIKFTKKRHTKTLIKELMKL